MIYSTSKTCYFTTAKCNIVEKTPPPIFIFIKGCDNNFYAALKLSSLKAIPKGENLSLSRRFGSAPYSNNNSTIEFSKFITALCNKVLPQLSHLSNP